MGSMIQHIFKNYFEIIAFSAALVALALMNPEAAGGETYCLFEQLGITFCPGEGLGHSISYTFRGEISNALGANVLGPLSIAIIGWRIGYLFNRRLQSIRK